MTPQRSSKRSPGSPLQPTTPQSSATPPSSSMPPLSTKIPKRRWRTEATQLLEAQCLTLPKDSIEHAYTTARLFCTLALEESKYGLALKDSEESKNVKVKLHAMVKGLGHILLEEEELVEVEVEVGKENKNPNKRKLPEECDRESKRLKKDHQNGNEPKEADDESPEPINGANVVKNIGAPKKVFWGPPSTSARRQLRKRTSTGISWSLIKFTPSGAGLMNDIGKNHCFLNVIIQSLWHLKVFRDKFMSKFEGDQRHVHIGNPSTYCESTASSRQLDCAVCALYYTFTDLNEVISNRQKRAVDATPLRSALSQLQPGGNLFEEGLMSDASEALEIIFKCIHTAFSPPSLDFASKTEDNIEECSLKCERNKCLVDDIFAMHIKHSIHPQLLHHANANMLREEKANFKDISFDKLLKLVVATGGLFDKPENEDPEEKNQVGYSSPSIPQVFTVVLGWTATEETQDIINTLTILEHEIDLSNMYGDLTPGRKHHLHIMICYVVHHYVCFVYDNERKKWIVYDDAIVEVIGTWEEVLKICMESNYQPHLLFYEAAHDSVKDHIT